MIAHSATLRRVLTPRNEIVHPRDKPVGDATFVGLEHIEPGTGRRIGSLPIRLDQLTGRKAKYYPGDIVYGYLRPYLNKVWLADSEGYCSVDQYVFKVSRAALPAYVAAFLRSPAFLATAPIDRTPGQLPRIRLDEVLNVRLALPPIDEQRRISAELNTQLAAIDRARDALAAQVDATSALSEAIMRRSLAGVTIAVRLGDALAETTQRVGQNWRSYPLIGASRAGLAPAKEGIGKSPEKYKLADKGTIFYNPMRILLGSIAYVDGRTDAGITSPDYVLFRTDPRAVNDRWLYTWLRSWRGQTLIRSLARGAVRERMLFRRLAPAMISVPSIESQRESAAIFAAISTMASRMRDQQSAFGGLVPELLRRTFAGDGAPSPRD